MNSANIIKTIAGTGVAGYNGDGIAATAAQFNNPYGVTTDKIGNIYIADGSNYRIRKIDTFGIITTIAGDGISSFSGDGGLATSAEIHHPYSPIIDKIGNLYFSDSARIRKIDTAGIITTIAGNGILGYSGDGGMATLAAIYPVSIALDTIGNIYIADLSTYRIRKIDTLGIISTIAGTGLPGYSGDDGDPLLARIGTPIGIALDNSGNIYFSDGSFYRVRLITTHPLPVSITAVKEQGISIYPNPSTGIFAFTISSAIDQPACVVVTNVRGEKVEEFSAITNRQEKTHLYLPPGIYFLSVTTKEKTFREKIIIQ